MSRGFEAAREVRRFAHRHGRIGVTLAVLAGVLAVVYAAGGVNYEVAPVVAPPLIAAGPTLPRGVTPYTTAVPPAADAPASDLIDYVRGLVGRRFGGMWLTVVARPAFRVGVVNPTRNDVRRIESAFSSIGTAGEVVAVRRSERQLVRINSYLAAGVRAANRGARSPVSVGLRADLNAVEVDEPPDSVVTPRQQAFVAKAVSDFGVNVRGVPSQGNVTTTLPCRDVFCDPPLRSGIWTYAGVTGCTGSFIARSRSDGRLFQMTAGHCRVVWNATWLTDFVNGVPHTIGRIHNSRFDSSGDLGITAVNNPPGWRSRAWVSVRGGQGTTTNPQYPIWDDASPVLGIRVCLSGAGSRLASCGVVTRTDVTLTYTDRRVTVSGLTEANFCPVPGDSGSPVFAGHVAYGVISGSSGVCNGYFEPVQTIEKLMNVNVAHDAR